MATKMRYEEKKNNSLVAANPQLASEWHPTKNGNLTPDMITKRNGQKVWWMCAYGHEWQATVSNRSRDRGCPYCLRSRGQKAIKGTNDFATAHPELVSEWHPTKNGDLTPDMVKRCSHKKVWWQCPNGHEWQATPANRSSGNGCPVCAKNKVKKGVNDLATVYPELAAEWHPTKNGDLTPDMVAIRSGRKVWWMCAYGHEWQAAVSNRSRGSGCPYCFKSKGHKATKGTNDFATVHPELVSEWHPTKNGDLTPDMVKRCSSKKVWWQCPNGHEWQATPANRNNGSGCPVCARLKRSLRNV